MAYTDLHVNGPAIVQVALTGGSYSNFGITEDGVDAEIRTYHEDVNTDDSGPGVPGDVQFFGEDATIRLNLIRWDNSVMNRVLALIRSGSTGQFAAADIGTLMIAASKYMSLKITSTARTGMTAEPSLTFPYVWLSDSVTMKVGTRVSRYGMTFRAVPVNGVLYTRA